MSRLSSQESSNSYAIKKKDEIERVAKASIIRQPSSAGRFGYLAVPSESIQKLLIRPCWFI